MAASDRTQNDSIDINSFQVNVVLFISYKMGDIFKVIRSHIRSHSGPHFPAFGLNTEIY